MIKAFHLDLAALKTLTGVGVYTSCATHTDSRLDEDMMLVP